MDLPDDVLMTFVLPKIMEFEFGGLFRLLLTSYTMSQFIHGWFSIWIQEAEHKVIYWQGLITTRFMTEEDSQNAPLYFIKWIHGKSGWYSAQKRKYFSTLWLYYDDTGKMNLISDEDDTITSTWTTSLDYPSHVRQNPSGIWVLRAIYNFFSDIEPNIRCW